MPDDPHPGPQVPRSLVMVRHGSTEWSRSSRHTGRTDIPLDEGGRSQSSELDRRLSGISPSLVLVSPLMRARQTCDLAGFGAMASVCDDLAEWDYGDYEGLTTPQIRQSDPGWDLWHDGCPGGESPADVARRADQVLARVRSVPGTVLAFAHGHLLRVLAARWLGWGPDAGAALMLAPAGVGVLTWERDHPAIGRWNDDGSALSG